MIMTGSVSVVDNSRRTRLTDNNQCIPLPLPGLASTINGRVHLLVGIRYILLDILGPFIDLFHRWFLLVNKLRNLLVQSAQFHHILFDLANGGRSLHGGASGLVGLSGSISGNLVTLILTRYFGEKRHTWKLCS